ncbi:MAG: septal ring lytic transglycosylase RlpA family protein [Erythrobacter sp.]
MASLALAPAASAQDGELDEAEFAKLFAPFDTKPPLYQPGEEEAAVDLTTITPRREITSVIRSLGTGRASFYGKRFHGRMTANGELFNMNAMTAAHKTLPFGTMVRVTNARNGRSVVVRINDRGPFIRGRVIDLSRAAARKIGMIQSGHASVRLEIIA